MARFVIYSDSSCDLPAPLAKQHMINIVPLKVSFDRITKLAEGVDINIDQFYDRMKTAPMVPKTYFPTVREYVSAFKKTLAEGQDVLCLCLSSKLSKGYESACNAREILSHAFKNNKVVVMDTLMAAGAQAALTLNAARLRDAGLTVDETHKTLIPLRDGAVTLFTVASLEQLARGGRVSRATATVGTLLHINPILHLENGELLSREKAIGRTKALSLIKRLAMESIQKNTNDYEFTVFHSRSLSDANTLEQEIRSEYGARWFNPTIEIGASIGSHTGVSVVAINCMKRIQPLS